MGEPISRPAKPIPKVPALHYYTSAFIFLFLLFYVSFSLCLVQVLANSILVICQPAMLIIPGNKKSIKEWFYNHYRSIIVITERSFGSLCVFLCAILTPETELVLTGDHELMRKHDKAILLANHQIYPDWLYLWMLARRYNRHGDLKIMLIAIMQYLPIFGFGMTMFEFIFMKQKLAKDHKTILRAMDRQKNLWKDFPLWLILFPEGTLNTPNNRATSRAFAKKTNMSEDPQVVILPKATGLFMVADALIDQVDCLFDLTVGYQGLEKEDIPYEEYLIDKVYFEAYYPKQIHIHVKKHSLKTLPGLNTPDAGTATLPKKTSVLPVADAPDQFVAAFGKEGNERRILLSNWLKEEWMEKDKRMQSFYEKGSFEGPSIKVRVKPSLDDWIVITGIGASSWMIIPLFWFLFRSALSLLYHLVVRFLF